MRRGIKHDSSVRQCSSQPVPERRRPRARKRDQPAIGALKTQYTTLIDEPYRVNVDQSGSLYMVNKDDDNGTKITSSGTASVLITGGFDDPLGIVVDLQYS